jgi:Anti-sigma regulatory factor (Ser/Thr protein kinase)
MSDERDKLIERLNGHAEFGKGGIVVGSAPGAGCTTLLRGVCDQKFSVFETTIPVYFRVRSGDEDSSALARRFAYSFLNQVIAFRRRDAKVAYPGIGLSELSRLSAAEDIDWVDRAVDRVEEKDAVTLDLERCLSIPLLASQAGLRPFIVFDDLQRLFTTIRDDKFLDALRCAASHYEFPFVLAGHRRFVSSMADYERLELDRLPIRGGAELVETLSSGQIDDASRDLIAVQTMGRPNLIEAIVRRSGKLDTFPCIERAYTEELFGGRIGRYFDELFEFAAPREVQPILISLLAKSIESGSKLCPMTTWQKALSMGAGEFNRMIEKMNVAELLRATSGLVQPMTEDVALSDYIRIRHRLENLGDNRATVFAASLSESIRRAPDLMATHYRRMTAIGLRGLLEKFDGRDVPMALLDYTVFKDRYQGRPFEEVEKDLSSDPDKTELPTLTFAAPAEFFYPSIAALIDRERAAVAVGFLRRTYSAEDEIYWVCAEIESKLEATAELAGFWCDRLETIAMASGFTNYRLWLISPAGFDAEAVEMLVQRNAFGSSRGQVELLKAELDLEKERERAGTEYEIVIPMGDETELVAAHTVEEIAKRHGFKSHDINQIKTALVEACINAAEHSHSPDGRTKLRFTVHPNRIKITVANRGLRLTVAAKPATDSQRRGWGLKLIKKLMDEVTIEQTDDGSRISMTKLLS